MFQFSGSPPTVLCIYTAVIGHEPNCVSTFGNLRVKRIFAPNRSLSQLIASFIGTWCQGIRPVLLLAWPNRIIWVYHVLSTNLLLLLVNYLNHSTQYPNPLRNCTKQILLRCRLHNTTVFLQPSALKNSLFAIRKSVRFFWRCFFDSTRRKRSECWRICEYFNKVMSKNNSKKRAWILRVMVQQYKKDSYHFHLFLIALVLDIFMIYRI